MVLYNLQLLYYFHNLINCIDQYSYLCYLGLPHYYLIYFHCYLLFIFIIIFPAILSKQIKLKSLIFSYEITAKIQGTGEKTILNGDIEPPNQIIINNGDPQIGSKTVKLDTSPTTIKMIWNSAPTSCSKMFFCLSDLIEVDLSNLECSNLENLNSTFEGCDSLEYANLTLKNGSNIQSMDNLFSGCTNLIDIDLSNFQPQFNISLQYMFKNCIKLNFADLSNFK